MEQVALNGQDPIAHIKNPNGKYLQVVYNRHKDSSQPYLKMLKDLQETGFGTKYNNRVMSLVWDLRHHGIIPYPVKPRKNGKTRKSYTSNRAQKLANKGFQIHTDEFLLEKTTQMQAEGMRIKQICETFTSRKWIHPRWNKLDGKWTYDVMLRLRGRKNGKKRQETAPDHAISVSRSKSNGGKSEPLLRVETIKKVEAPKLELTVDGDALEPNGPLLDLGQNLQFDAKVSVIVTADSTLKMNLQLQPEDWKTKRLLKAIMG